MKATLIGLALLAAQDGKGWKPYQFKGNERYEYKVITSEGEEKKETGFILDLRDKGAEAWEATWAVKSPIKKGQGPELLMGGWNAGLAPVMMLVHPVFGGFLEQVPLKAGEKLSILGIGTVKVIKEESVGGRKGLLCELYLKQEDKDVLGWTCVIDPELALPIRSVTYDGGQEKFRMELLSFKKD